MSFWKVPDAQTAELFDVFYAECFSGKTIQEAFLTAQAKMKLKYRLISGLGLCCWSDFFNFYGLPFTISNINS